MKAKTASRLQEKEALKGYLFLLPLMFGLLMFFVIPMIDSVRMSLCDVTMTPDGRKMTFAGFDYFKEALFVNNDFGKTASSSVLNMLLTTPLVMIFSFFMASVLNQKFRGRTFFRVVLFIPVIIMMTAGQTNALESQMSGMSSYKDTFDVSAEAFTTQIANYLLEAGVSEKITGGITNVTNMVYSVINLSGIQILIMLTGMQSISPALYEAAKVEGGTAWENFWKITFPMVSPLILTSFIYTIIDSFTASSNGLMGLLQSTAFTDLHYSLASAMAIIYFAVVAVIVAVVTFIVSRFVFYYDD